MNQVQPIKWEQVERETGHRWRDDRGPDSHCEYCGQIYGQWSGDSCPKASPPAPRPYSADGTSWWDGQQWVDLTRGPVSVPPKAVNNVFHLLMSVFTLGFWFPVWMALLILRRHRTVRQLAWNGRVWRPVSR